MKIQIELSDGSDSASGKLSVKLVGMDGTKHEVTMARYYCSAVTIRI